MSWEQAVPLIIQLAMGISLAACAGLRAFLPLLVVGVAGRLELLPLAGSFGWLASTPALVVFGAAVVIELLGDKVPAVDHVLDTVQAFVKPVAGIVLVAAVLTDLSPLQSSVLGLVLGGPSAGVVHLIKAQARLVTTISTAGLGNPIVSTVEDAGALIGSLVALVVPLLALVFFITAAILFVTAIRRARRRPPASDPRQSI